MKNKNVRDRNFETWVMLAQTRRAMFRARSQGLLRFGISPRQAAIMFMIITLGDSATPSELARSLFREPHTVSELLIRMEKTGLVRRVSDLEKKNLVRIELTEKGYDIYMRSAAEEPVHKIMASLSEDEHRALRQILRKLWNTAMEELGMERKILFLGKPYSKEQEGC